MADRFDADTFGVIVDLDYLRAHGGIADLRASLVSTDALRMLDIAERMPMRYLVAAGRLDLASAGVAGAAAADEENAIRAMVYANARLVQEGSRATAWVFFCDSALQKRAEAALAVAAGFEGGQQ